MAFFIGLVGWYMILWAVSLAFPLASLADIYQCGAFSAGIMFLLVGISHFAKPAKLEAMIPPSWPFRKGMNYVSGAFEILLGGMLFTPEYRTVAAFGLIALLLAVFPANIYVAKTKPNTYNISRLFFQPLYVAWIWLFCIH